jgi:hypothetical protein
MTILSGMPAALAIIIVLIRTTNRTRAYAEAEVIFMKIGNGTICRSATSGMTTATGA